MEQDNKAQLLRSLNAAAAYKNSTLFIKYLERLVILDNTQDELAEKFDIGVPALHGWFRKEDITWDEVEQILELSGYQMVIRGVK